VKDLRAGRDADRVVVSSARWLGEISARATRGQRDLQKFTAAYPEMFGDAAFDAALSGAVALANAVSAPEAPDAAVWAANRAGMWAFALDQRVDLRSRTADEVDGLAARCVAVAGGAPADPAAPLEVSLAGVRAGLVEAPAFGHIGPLWISELTGMVVAMATEWHWLRARGPMPSPSAYLENAANLGFSFVFASFLVALGGAPDRAVADLVAASHAAQRAIRLVNDLATYDRDVDTGDLNVLMLGISRGEAVRLVQRYADECRDLLASVRRGHPVASAYVRRQVEFNRGFHSVTDYWATA
jgi:hypothetical protein